MNTITIHGRLGQDPETKFLENGKRVSRFSIAEGDKKHTNWFRCEAWGKTSELIEQYFSKGSEIVVSGSAKVEKYNEKEYHKIIVNSFDFCGSKPEQRATDVIGKEPELARSTDSQDLPF